jgi:DNA-binding response OmpR family regulator
MLFGKRERLIRRILVVEDEPLVAFDNEHLLSDAGYDVVGTVDNLADASRLIEEEEIDLVLSDVACRAMATGWTWPARPRPRACRCCLSPGRPRRKRTGLGVGCLMKPYSAKGLKAALEALDEKLQGKKVKRLPAGLSLYERA